jgi:hypothetical protein
VAVEGEDVRAIERLQASSGRVSYSPVVVLHESRKQRIVFVPFYIPRTAGTQLAVKIQSYQKGPPPDDWVLIEDKSVSLNEQASRALLRGLREHLAVAKDASDDGNYILIRVSEGTAQLGEHDPGMVAAALTKVLSQEEILQHLGQTELSDELVKALRGAIRLKEMRAAVAELRQHLEAGQTDEGVYQGWCEEHSWAFGNAYVVRDPVRDISAGDRTDLLLPTVISGFRDIVELKRPDMDVLIYDRAHRDHYWSADVSRAIGQAHRYLDVLHEEAANGLRDHPDIVAYHPRAIIVIGRSADWDPGRLKALRGLNSRLNGITVMTYDQLLAQGERLLAMLSERAEEAHYDDGFVAEDMNEPGAGEMLEDDDIPF